MSIELGAGGQDADEGKYARWYEHGAPLSQGSILRNTRVWEELPTSTDEVAKPAPRRIDAIVLTQSCDIVNKKGQARLLVAEIQTYRSIAEQKGGFFRSSQYRKELSDGITLAEFLLPPAEGAIEDWSVVNFRELYTVNRSRLGSDDDFVGLDSPYREHLGQAFARFMMRVGLPTVVDDFEKYKL